MPNTSLKKSFDGSRIIYVVARFLCTGILPIHGLLPSPAYGQDFKPEQFDQNLIEESLRDQQILREEMLLEQEILREEMEQIRIEIQRIMKEIALSMREEALKLKAELEGLQLETKAIQEEILGILEKSKQDFADGKQEMQKELEQMRKEAKTMTTEIKQVLQEQKAVWKQETEGLQESLIEARNEMNSAKADSKEVLQSSRSAFSDFKQEQNSTLADSREESSAAMLEAGNTFKKSQQDYKDKSKSITNELVASMKDARESMQRKQQAQRQDSENSQREVLAALKTSKNKRIAELKHDTAKKNLQNKKSIRSTLKQEKKQGRIKKVEKRQILLKESKPKIRDTKTKNSRKTERPKNRVVSKAKEKKVNKLLARKKATRKESVLQSSQDNKSEIVSEGQEALDKDFNRTFGDTKIKEIEKKPEQKIGVVEDTESVVASLPDTKLPASEETPQEKLSQFSKNITDLKNEIKNSNQNPELLLIQLGDAYLEAQHFMDSQEGNEERQTLLNFSEEKELLLGSYEQAAWAYKLALTFNQKSARTHLKIGRIYDEMEDGENALMYAKLAHQIFKRDHKSSELEEAQSFIESLTSKYEDNSEKKTVHKG